MQQSNIVSQHSNLSNASFGAGPASYRPPEKERKTPPVTRELTVEKIMTAHAAAKQLIKQKRLDREPTAGEVGGILRQQGFRVYAAQVIALLSEANALCRDQKLPPLKVTAFTNCTIIQAYSDAEQNLRNRGFKRNPVFKELKSSLELAGWRLGDVSLYERLRAINRNRKRKLDVSPLNDEKLLKICLGVKAEIREKKTTQLPTLQDLHEKVTATGWDISQQTLRTSLNRLERQRPWKQEELVAPQRLTGRLLRRLHHQIKLTLKQRNITRDPFADEIVAAVKGVGVRCGRRQLLARLRDLNKRLRNGGQPALHLGDLNDKILARLIKKCQHKESVGITYDQLLGRLRKEGYALTRQQVIKRVAKMNGRRLEAGQKRLVVRNARGRGKVPADAIMRSCRDAHNLLRKKNINRAPLDKEVCQCLRREGYKMQPKALFLRVTSLNQERATKGKKPLMILRSRDILSPELVRDTFLLLRRELGRNPLLTEYCKELSNKTGLKVGSWHATDALRAYNHTPGDGNERLILNSDTYGLYDEDITCAHADLSRRNGLPPSSESLREYMHTKDLQIPPRGLQGRILRLRRHGLELPLRGVRKVSPELLKTVIPTLARKLGAAPSLQQVKAHLNDKYKISINGNTPIIRAIRQLKAMLPNEERAKFELRSEPSRKLQVADFEKAFFAAQRTRPQEGRPARVDVKQLMNCSLQTMQQLHGEANDIRALKHEMPLLFSGHPTAKQLRIIAAFERVLESSNTKRGYVDSLASELGWSDRYLRNRMRKLNTTLHKDGLVPLPLPSSAVTVGNLFRPRWERHVKVCRIWAIAGVGLNNPTKEKAIHRANIRLDSISTELGNKLRRNFDGQLENVRSTLIGLHLLNASRRLSEEGLELLISLMTFGKTPAALVSQIDSVLDYSLKMCGLVDK